MLWYYVFKEGIYTTALKSFEECYTSLYFITFIKVFVYSFTPHHHHCHFYSLLNVMLCFCLFIFNLL